MKGGKKQGIGKKRMKSEKVRGVFESVKDSDSQVKRGRRARGFIKRLMNGNYPTKDERGKTGGGGKRAKLGNKIWRGWEKEKEVEGSPG